MKALKDSLPEPELYGANREPRSADRNEELDILIIGWGSTKNVLVDVLRDLSRQSNKLSSTERQSTSGEVASRLGSSRGSSLEESKIGYLHYSHLWPLKTEKLLELSSKAKKVVIVEGNNQSQLGMLIKQETGLSIEDKILKYDGRPFFYEEILERILNYKF